ncbi:MAG TPA: LytTR family DNA-binding domain-containing protein [Gemmatimonadaceae bacterium]|nr:LytTR family DNA-binding domain-containing protein [Gemmatimonadaceae bacterium]
MRVVLVDDEPVARRGLRQLLAVHDDAVVVGEARNGREAVRVIDTLAPDLVFLDVQMPELDGFEVLRRLEGRLPAVIFVTAYDTFAVRAFDAHALDYLVKPVHEDRFRSAVARARERLRTADAVELSRRLSSFLAGGSADELEAAKSARRLVVPGNGTEIVLDPVEIQWIEADDYYAAVHARGRRHLVRESLDSLERRLDPTRFVRTHRSAIVNLACVRELRSESDGSVVVLADGTRVPLGRRRRERFVEALRRFAG